MTNRRIWRGTVVVAFALATAACGDAGVDSSAVSMHVVGDSLFQMAERAGEGGAGTVECRVLFRMEVQGGEGSYAVIRGGRVDYWWWTTGASAGSREWDQQEIQQLWVDTVFAAGQPRLSHPAGFGQSTPAQPVRGEAYFTYSPGTSQEVRRTETFRFYCY
jgi:hypothetical protein